MNNGARLSLPGDEPAMKSIWQTVFGDSKEMIDDYFARFYSPGSAAVYEADGKVVSAAYALHLGDLVTGVGHTPCSVLYALATDPEYRVRGYGSEVVKLASELTQRDGIGVISPAEESLFGYYERFNYKSAFYAAEYSGTDAGTRLFGSAIRIDAQEYSAIRRKMLAWRQHIDFSDECMAYQQYLCESSGGALYAVTAGGVKGCAAAEVWDGRVKIKELLMPSGSQYSAALLVCRALGIREFTALSPASTAEKRKPVAMMLGEAPADNAWFGFDFG